VSPALVIRLALLPCLALALASCRREAGPVAGSVEVKVDGVGLDPRTDSPVVVLRERSGIRQLPIWIGTSEAQSIALQLERIEPPRPNTHDLAKRLLAGLDARIERVIVTELRGGTYYAVIVVRNGARLFEVDARPSDAIALGLRMGAPLFVSERLFEDAEGEEEPPGDGSEGPEIPL